jgi:glutathione peroxidase
MSRSVFEFSATTIDGRQQPLGIYRGKTLLIVNVASRCGYTPQYAGLERLYRTWRDRGCVVLGFPCDQFGHQEPGDEAAIQKFCTDEYDVTFPLFAKIRVNGDGAHPLYEFLKHEQAGLFGSRAIKWNFTKFLVDADGRVVRRYGSARTPESIAPDIAALIEQREARSIGHAPPPAE